MTPLPERTRWPDERIDDLAAGMHATARLPVELAATREEIKRVGDLAGQSTRYAEAAIERLEEKIDDLVKEMRADRRVMRVAILGALGPVAAAVVAAFAGGVHL